METALYFGAPSGVGREDLGLLSQLPGRWVGNGFNLIARPDKQNNQPFFLELNATKETIDFSTIGGNIPNRGSLQGDIDIHGIHYLQQVMDRKDNSGIHIEPGLWLHVPATTNPVVPESYVRQATIPHGDSLVAQSTLAITVKTGPLIKAVDSTPFTDTVIPDLNASPTKPVNGGQYLKPFETDPLPQFLPADLNPAQTIKNPALVLLADIKGQEITNTVVIQISTKPSQLPGLGIVNTAFVDTNANATQMDAIFWIETVKDEHGEFLQLQYVQRVILDFIGIHWPHISVATLRKQRDFARADLGRD